MNLNLVKNSFTYLRPELEPNRKSSKGFPWLKIKGHFALPATCVAPSHMVLPLRGSVLKQLHWKCYSWVLILKNPFWTTSQEKFQWSLTGLAWQLRAVSAISAVFDILRAPCFTFCYSFRNVSLTSALVRGAILSIWVTRGAEVKLMTSNSRIATRLGISLTLGPA